MTTETPNAPPRVSPGYANLVLAMLLLVYTFNWLDRQILGILAPAIKADLGLTNTQLGVLGGIAFAALYSTLAIPLAMVADRTSRTWVITISMVVWSGFTALCGLAGGFWQLFLFRLGVGVGEAGGVAPSYALISQYFPPEKRARAISIYSLGIPVGLACGVLFGAAIAKAVDWRAAFIVVGLAGVVIAPIFRLVVKEPPKVAPVAAASGARVPMGAVFAILARKRSFWLMAYASAMSSTAGYGLAFWTPSILMQSFGFDLSEVSYFVGSLLLIGGMSGVFLGGVLGDRLGRGDRGAYAKVSSLAWVLTAPLFVAGFLAPSPVLAWALLLIPNALNVLFVGPLTTATQHLVPPSMRATAAASFLLINNLIGIGAGSWLLGGLSDVMAPHFGANALRYSAIALVCLYFVASALTVLAVRPLRRDWVDDPAV